MNEKLDAGDINTGKACIRSIIDAIEVDDRAIQIIGGKDILQAAVAGKQTENGNVRDFVRTGAPEEIRTTDPQIRGLTVKRAQSVQGVDAGVGYEQMITIESLRRAELRRFDAATFLLPLPRRFHERNFRLKSGQQKALENEAFSRACCLVAGIGFEPMTFRL
ncbi:hypothetical protein ACVWXO_001607 [Bradyrhizobium sp. LM2.7]